MKNKARDRKVQGHAGGHLLFPENLDKSGDCSKKIKSKG